jgi:cell division ATPase FtsA
MVEKNSVKFKEEEKEKAVAVVNVGHGETNIIDYGKPRPKADPTAYAVD